MRTAADLGLFDVASSGPREEAAMDERPRRHSFHESGSGAGARQRAGAAEQPQQQAAQQQQVTPCAACTCCSASPQAARGRQLRPWPELLSRHSSRRRSKWRAALLSCSGCHLQLECTAGLCTRDSLLWEPLGIALLTLLSAPRTDRSCMASAALSHDLRAGLCRRPGWDSSYSHSRAPAGVQAAAGCRPRSAGWPPCRRPPARAAC